ncbi:peptidase [Enterobacteriaceae bacterium ESL0689]|nr:peptidase [Enterobacteriaceae bacterium ESL0689]
MFTWLIGAGGLLLGHPTSHSEDSDNNIMRLTLTFRLPAPIYLSP